MTFVNDNPKIMFSELMLNLSTIPHSTFVTFLILNGAGSVQLGGREGESADKCNV